MSADQRSVPANLVDRTSIGQSGTDTNHGTVRTGHGSPISITSRHACGQRAQTIPDSAARSTEAIAKRPHAVRGKRVCRDQTSPSSSVRTPDCLSVSFGQLLDGLTGLFD